MAWRAPGTLAGSPEFRFRYGSLLVVLVGVMVTSLLTLLLSPGESFAAVDRLGLGLLALKNVVLSVWLWRRPADFVRVGLLELGLEAAAGLYKFWGALHVGHAAFGLGGYSYWLSLNYFVASLVLRPRAALAASLGWFAALLTVGGLFWFAPETASAQRSGVGNALLQLYLSHLTLMAFLTLQGRLLRRYLRAIVRAEREARFARLDGLTDLANRRQLDAWLAEAGGARSGASSSLTSTASRRSMTGMGTRRETGCCGRLRGRRGRPWVPASGWGAGAARSSSRCCRGAPRLRRQRWRRSSRRRSRSWCCQRLAR